MWITIIDSSVVEITSPLADTYVKGTVDFRGTVNEPNLLDIGIEY